MKTLEVQGQRVKVGGPARGRRAAGPHRARGRPGPWRISPEGSGSGAAASTRLRLRCPVAERLGCGHGGRLAGLPHRGRRPQLGPRVGTPGRKGHPHD
ncbi:hypothetical protein E2I00_011808 [Balaenoptera physalus]|uniref:Uncharacterized protein n=1 Tax=Balaenoptera physalus TaxID=9770 RepID=A0A6A1Q415_BALPH|nr:hypothetical protein E2I00_011808 [Balaenoptera physalus]